MGLLKTLKTRYCMLDFNGPDLNQWSYETVTIKEPVETKSIRKYVRIAPERKRRIRRRKLWKNASGN